MQVACLTVGQLKTNCYLLYDEGVGNCVIIDPGDDADFIERKIADLDITPKAILATHGHYDHILAATELQLAYDLPFYINKNDKFLLPRMQRTAKFFSGIDPGLPPKNVKFLSENKKYSKAGISLDIISTPGHTPGGVSLYNSRHNLLFVGDLIFADGNVGRYDLSYSNFRKISDSVKKIFKLPDYTLVYSGHGKMAKLKTIKHLYKNIYA